MNLFYCFDIQEALAETKANEKVLQRHKVQEVGRAYLNHLIEEEQYEKAARYSI